MRKVTEPGDGRYKYPAKKKSVFKTIICYKYQPRPATPKNYFPRPKSSNRYVFTGQDVMVTEGNIKDDQEVEDMKQIETEEIEDEGSPEDEMVKAEEDAGDISNSGQDTTEAGAEVEAETGESTDEAADTPASQQDEELGDTEEPEGQMAVESEEGQTEEAVEAAEVVETEEAQPESNEKEDKVDTNQPTEKEVKVDLKPSEKPELKSVDDPESKLGNWFNKEIRSRIQVTPKGWELRGAG